jgi:hypothetical protein
MKKALIFSAILIWIFSNQTVNWSLTAISIIAILSAIEETAILLSSRFYDAGRKSIISVKLFEIERKKSHTYEI